jgi:uncharacterized protein YdeI (YjbR/CyaY-like superfamily)
MPNKDPRVDAYIEKSADFAKPILTHLRKLVHKASPKLSETVKWGMPAFEYKGIVCGMAAFKEHCTFGFWKHSLLDYNGFSNEGTAMGSFGRITSKKDLPTDDTIVKLVQQAVELNENGVKVAKPKLATKKELVVPEYLTAALKKNKAAQKTFEDFPYSCKKEYVEWITEAKTEPTREKRLATTLEWLSEGKRRNWKYENC